VHDLLRQLPVGPGGAHVRWEIQRRPPSPFVPSRSSLPHVLPLGDHAPTLGQQLVPQRLASNWTAFVLRLFAPWVSAKRRRPATFSSLRLSRSQARSEDGIWAVLQALVQGYLTHLRWSWERRQTRRWKRRRRPPPIMPLSPASAMGSFMMSHHPFYQNNGTGPHLTFLQHFLVDEK
jgi:hypothetical protein